VYVGKAQSATTFSILTLGWVLAISGVVWLVNAFSALSWVGIFLMSTWPTTSTYFIGLAIGIDLIFDGAALVGFAGAIHSLPNVQTTTRRAA